MKRQGEADYSRGQLESALWSAFTQASPGSKINLTFRGRIRKLLDLDRAQPERVGEIRFGVHSAPPAGKGVEVRYRLLDALALAVGLDLLDLGFKQSEVIYLLRHLRKDLAHELENMKSDPPVLRGRRSDEADRRIFLLLRKVQASELFPGHRGDNGPLVINPRFVKGPDLARALDELAYNDRARVIIEIAEIAELIRRGLEEAPEVRRGRS